jgi:pyruvate/2-oxoglutarate dehydrogenase complex dihydrolipoamide acyltransferase (E2) component
MATEVTVPKIGFSMSEGVLTEWLVADGATVEEGQAIYALESDKSVNEVESPAAGVIKILVQPDDEPIAVGTVVGEIG